MILACSNIQKAYGIEVIIDKVSFHIEEKEKAAIVGVNGAGKTTLFKIITGEITADKGEVIIPKDCTMGYMAQNQQIDSEQTIYDEMLSVFAPLLELEGRMRDMEQKMALLEGKELSAFMEQYADLQHEFEQKDGYSYKSRMKGVLKGLGFREEEFDKPLNQLSGGQKTRVYLGRLLLSQPDILLLDEPTNHLDIESLQWLEDFLKGYQGAVLLISHDRYFMDRIVTKVVEIENKKAFVYEGNYSFYANQKEINREIQQKAYTQQQKEIKHQEDVIKTLKSFNREKSVKRAESREKMLNKVERLDRPESLPDKMRLTLTPKIISGNDVIHVEGLSKAYGAKKLFEQVEFDIKREEKVAIIGPNGVGKSTLFKILMKQVAEDTGLVRFGTNVKMGYYDQELQQLDENKTIFQEIADTYPTMNNGQIRTTLAAFVFTGDDIFKPISALSGGEKGRVSLAKIMLSEANLLMLDEPTNHLDMYSKEILEDALNCYEGTVIYISHDRYFMNRTAQRILELTPKGVNQYLGNYDYYMEKKTERIREENERAKLTGESTATVQENDSRAEWLRQKEEQAKIRKIGNKIAKLEKEIEKTEGEIAELEKLLLKEEIATNADKAREIYEEKTELSEKLEQLYDAWGELQ